MCVILLAGIALEVASRPRISADVETFEEGSYTRHGRVGENLILVVEVAFC